ncbi:hypothetical protein VWY69_00345 [Phaeobacter sp. A90a-4k]|uniref:hypothetical protein n=1 Tax=unclassified Phaeobacter TaxID=2621772 RepID=UPI003A843E63
MKYPFLGFGLAALIAACSVNEPKEATNITTATVSGQAYDVFHDPYDPYHAIIFGKRPLDPFSLPKEEIIAAATPCALDRDSLIVLKATDMKHPTRPDLENLGWVPVKCPASPT